MTKISAYTALQESFGNEQAKALAEFVESQDKPDFSKLVTKDDLSRFSTKDDLKDLELRFTKEIAKTREDMISRTNWATIIQVLTTVGALLALSKVL